MYGTYDHRYPFQLDTFSVPRSHYAPASDDSDDNDSPVGGGGPSSVGSGRSYSSQSTTQQGQNQESIHQPEQDSPYSPSRQDLPQVLTPPTRAFSLPPEHQSDAALPQQYATEALSGDNPYRSQTSQVQHFQHGGTQSPILGYGGQAHSGLVTLSSQTPLGVSSHHHPSVRSSSTPSSSSASVSDYNSPTVAPSALQSQSQYPDAGDYLRHQLGLPPGIPVNLDCLPDPPAGRKPSQSYPVLIKLAIYGSPNKRLTLKGIYEAIENRFEYFRLERSGAWKRSIRHNLSLNQVFKNTPRPLTEPGKGSYWELDISQGEGNKRERKRRKKPTARQRGQARQGQGQQESESDSQSSGEEEEESEISSHGRSESPAQRASAGEGGNIGPHRVAYAAPFARRSSPYPAAELIIRSRTASPAWGSGHAYAADAGRAATPTWGPGHAGGQGQGHQVASYHQQQPYPLPPMMTGQEGGSQQLVFRSGPFAHTVAWHAQQHMRQQSLTRPSSSVSPQFPYTASMSPVGVSHAQLGNPVVASPVISGGIPVGSTQIGGLTVAPLVVTGGIQVGSAHRGDPTVPPPVVPGGIQTETVQYPVSGEEQMYEGFEEYQADSSMQGQESRHKSRNDQRGDRG